MTNPRRRERRQSNSENEKAELGARPLDAYRRNAYTGSWLRMEGPHSSYRVVLRKQKRRGVFDSVGCVLGVAQIVGQA
jgi:hypothetical protein